MGRYGFSSNGGVNNFSSLFVELNLVNVINIHCQYLKIKFLEVYWCLWLLHSWIYERHLHLSFLDVKSWHQLGLIGRFNIQILCIRLCLQFLIPHLDFFKPVLNIIIISTNLPSEKNFYIELSFQHFSLWSRCLLCFSRWSCVPAHVKLSISYFFWAFCVFLF